MNIYIYIALIPFIRRNTLCSLLPLPLKLFTVVPKRNCFNINYMLLDHTSITYCNTKQSVKVNNIILTNTVYRANQTQLHRGQSHTYNYWPIIRA